MVQGTLQNGILLNQKFVSRNAARVMAVAWMQFLRKLLLGHSEIII